MTPRPPPLLQDFPPATYADWRTAAEKLLKGAPFEKKLLTPLPEEITLQPIYNASDLPSDSSRHDLPGFGSRIRHGRAAGFRHQSWLVSQELPISLPDEFNAVAKHEASQGQTEIHLLLDAAGRAGLDPDNANPGDVGACGTSIASLRDLTIALDGLDWSRLSLALSVGSGGLPIGILLLAWAQQQHLDLTQLRGAILSDPVSDFVRTGNRPTPLASAFDETALLTSTLHQRAPGMTAYSVEANIVHEAGGHGVQELTYSLALAVTYLRELSQRGIPLHVAASSVRFSFSVGSNFFAEIAKLRAARQLWSRVLTGCGLNPANIPMPMHGRTSLRNKTRLDAHTNLLRTTTEAMSAVLGGCTSLHVGPYDEVFQVPDAFSRRISRNTSIILAEECGLAQVIDPAGGSYFVESLTRQMSELAWSKFQEIEKQGGLLAALASGTFQAAVASTAESRRRALGTRRDTMIGVNTFPNEKDSFTNTRLPNYQAIYEKRSRDIAAQRVSADLTDDHQILKDLTRLTDAHPSQKIETAIQAAISGATLGELVTALRSSDPNDTKAMPSISPLPMRRTAAMYEELRQACAKAAQNGMAPKILQLNLGASRAFRARADWTTNFFSVAGFQVDAGRDFDTVETALAAVKESEASIVVLCSSDEGYPRFVPNLLPALKAEESRRGSPFIAILLAGAPGDQENAYRQAGITDFVHVRVPHHAFVSDLLQRQGVLS
jgi:methylmalonyl-CoA mutase